ncbi:MAG: RluA family pseudouridine synthase [Lachnospiraceae bacterium]|nr:RluA family pseudouridine synthase [Lachnospiraceae bacterium]
MTRVLEYRVNPEDLSRTAGGILGKTLKICMGLTPHEISHAKYVPEGITVLRQLPENGGPGQFVPALVNDRVRAGDVVRVQFTETASEEQKVIPAEGMDVQILYEDEDVAVLNKPAGIVSHPSHGHYRDSMANYLAGFYEKRGIEGMIRTVGRLDKDTSGIIVFAKNAPAASRLFRQKEQGIFRKTYLAVAAGSPGEGEWKRWNVVDLPIGPIPGVLMKQQIIPPPDGKPALTRYQCCGRWEDASLILAEIETGRTHQIRIHMASIGHPLMGDSLYGKDTSGPGMPDRTLLHAWKAVFRKPFGEEEIRVAAPVPDDMAPFIVHCGISM